MLEQDPEIRATVVEPQLQRETSPALPVLQDTTSQELFRHFCSVTVPWMLFSNRHDWLIFKHVVPLALSDELVMQSLLAMSGVHMRLLHPDRELHASYHYDHALRTLKERLAEQEERVVCNHRTLLTAMILLCHYEVSVSLSAVTLAE